MQKNIRMPDSAVLHVPKTSFERVLARIAAGAGTTFLLIAAILAGSMLGRLAPASGNLLGGAIDHTVLLLVSLLIFEVRFSALRRSWSNARFLAIAWAANFILVPTAGLCIASLFLSGQPLFFTGLIIYFMAPCTDWFLGFTRLAKGDTALGAVLLPINMITQLLLYPVYLAFFADGVAPVDTETIGATLLQWFVVPFTVAVVLHQVLAHVLSAASFERLLAWTGYLIPFVIALLIIEVFAANVGVIIVHAPIFTKMLAVIFLFFVATFLICELISKATGLIYPQRALLTMTTAARNAPMMLGITAIAMPNQPLIYAAIIIGMLVEFPHLTALRQILIRSQGSDAGGRLIAMSPPETRDSEPAEKRA